MTKIKLADGTIINVESVALESGVLKITTTEHTVKELAEIFSNKENTNLIILMTPSEIETGYKTGFTSFAGIDYYSEGFKVVKLFQPVDVTEARVSNAEGSANKAIVKTSELESTITALLGVE